MMAAPIIKFLAVVCILHGGAERAMAVCESSTLVAVERSDGSFFSGVNHPSLYITDSDVVRRFWGGILATRYTRDVLHKMMVSRLPD